MVTNRFTALVALSSAVLIATSCGRVGRPVRSEYSGRIVERWAFYSQSEEGSRPNFRLRIQTAAGEQLTVRVTSDVYYRAEVGMWIELKNGQTTLGARKVGIESQTNAPTANRAFY